jgi:hypothetical protein
MNSNENIFLTMSFFSPGRILSFLGLQKSLKKSKRVNLIQMKLLKKFLTIFNILMVDLIFLRKLKGIFLFLNTLYSDINYPYQNPLTLLKVEPKTKLNLSIGYILFKKSSYYSIVKNKKKSRIKKKIKRKLIRALSFDF